MHRALPAVLTASALVWAMLLFVAPLTASAFVYEFASGICHQRPERSFQFAGAQMPVCARCLGLYLSGAAGAAAAFLPRTGVRGAPDVRTARLVFGLAALPTITTVILEWLGLAYPSNAARAIASVPLGAAAGWVFVRMLRAESAAAMRYHS